MFNLSFHIANRMDKIFPSGIRVIRSMGIEMEQKGVKVIQMTSGEPDFITPRHIIEAAKKALDEGFTHYTSFVGIPELRKAIANKYTHENRVSVNEDEVLVSAGGNLAGFVSLMATINPGDEVIIPDPSWMNYRYWTVMAGGKPIHVPVLEENDFRLIPEDIESKITSKTKMIIINSPCNPTGSVLRRKDLDEISEIVKDNDLLILADEVYEKIIYDRITHYSIASFPGMKERTITINALSKTYAMTGWRIGYAIAEPKLIDEMKKIQLYTATHPASFVQKASVAAISGPQNCVDAMLNEYTVRRRILVNGLNDIGIPCKAPDGTFYVFANIKKFGISSREFAESLLKKAHVATVFGSTFGEHGEGYIRFSFATSRENIELALENIRKNIKNV